MREFERVIMQSYISKHGQNKIQFVSHPNTSLVSPFTLLLSSVTVGIDLLFVKPVFLSLYSGTEKAKQKTPLFRVKEKPLH